MKATKSKKNKLIRSIILIAALLACSTQSALSSGWFTNKIDLAGTNQLAASFSLDSSVQFSAYSLGDRASLILSGYHYQEQRDEDLLSLVNLSSAGAFDEAESLFKQIVYSEISDPSENQYTGYKVLQAVYTFSYDNNHVNPANAYVCFVPGNNYQNAVDVNGSLEFCYQTLAYADQYNNLAELPRLNFVNRDSAYYYPYQLYPNEQLTLVCTIFASDNTINQLNPDEMFSFELIQSNNNASVIEWNVVINEYGLYPYDSSVCLESNYLYDINISQMTDNGITDVIVNESNRSKPDENEPDENEPDENEPNENEPNENEPGENEPDENEPDENEPDKNEPDVDIGETDLADDKDNITGNEDESDELNGVEEEPGEGSDEEN